MTATAPRRRWIRWVALALLVLLLLPLGAVAVFALTFDANAWKLRIDAAVQAATGRGFTIAGPIGTKLSLRPTVTLADVTLGNPPGYSRPAMATVRRAEVQVALLPMLSRRLEVARLVLDGADLLLERDAQGTPNWVLARPAAPAPSAPPSAPAAPARPFGIGIDQVLLTDSRIALREAPAATPQVLALRHVALDAVGAERRLRLEGAVAWQDRPVTLSGEAGPLAALLAGAAAPWPLRLDLTAEGGVALRVEGALTPPSGYRVAVSGRVADVASLAPLLPDLPLPPLREVAAQAVLAGQGGLPAVSDLRVTVGRSELGIVGPGIVLEGATLALPALDQPLAIDATLRRGGVPLAIAARLGAPARLLGGSTGAPWPIEVTGQSGEARLALSGGFADPLGLRGGAFALSAAAPALAAVMPLLAPGTAAPALTGVTLQARIVLPGAGAEGPVEVHDLKLATSAGDLAGSLAASAGPRRTITGELRGARLDLDALRTMLPPAGAGPAGAGPAAPETRPGQPAAVPNATHSATPAQDRRLIPEIRLPLDLLRLADADLTLALGVLRAGGTDWRDLQGRLVLAGGRGRLDPVAAGFGGAGRITLRAAADITADPPVVQVALRSEALNLGAIPAAAGATGRLGLDIDLRGRGRDTRAIAASAFGRVGVTLEGGSLPPSLLGNLLAGLRQRVPMIGDLAARPLDLACVAMRLDAEDGLAAARVALAETSLGRIGAADAGTISLRDERLALRLNADLRVPVPGLANGLRIRAPVPVTGTLAQPRPEWNAAAGAALQGEIADRAGREAGQVLGALGGLLAGRADAGPGPIPDCAQGLALARGQAAPTAAAAPAPAPPPAAAPAPEPHRRDPVQDLIRRVPLDRLFGR